MPTTRETYLNAAREIEEKLKIPVSVIKRIPSSPIPLSTVGDGYFLYIIAKEESTFSTLIKARKLFPYLGISQALPIEDFIAATKKNRKRIRNNMGGTGLIAPFFFHEEIYGNYAKGFKKAVLTNFKNEFDEGMKNWLANMHIHSPKDFRTRAANLKRAREVERKIVGPKEHKYLVKELDRMAKEIKDSDAEVLIVFEKAARYLAEPLKKILLTVYQKKPLVFFVDPNIVKTAEFDLTFGTGAKTNYGKIKALFEKEFPNLIKAINGKRITLVDDQSCSGGSKTGMERLLSQYEPKTLGYTHLSTTDTAPEPSWRKQNLYTVEEKANSFRVKRAKVDAQKRRQVRGLKSNLNRVANRIINGRKR